MQDDNRFYRSNRYAVTRDKVFRDRNYWFTHLYFSRLKTSKICLVLKHRTDIQKYLSVTKIVLSLILENSSVLWKEHA